ncbi:ABC transporter ATP-binding protein [Streptosporangium sp. NPDC000563]|uniref:ABC transporter ATP-binding protein n=1 Tax=Streptosporangium sp. NPDC000563 TaxID=3154366 RepID=UPI00331C3B82
MTVSRRSPAGGRDRLLVPSREEDAVIVVEGLDVVFHLGGERIHAVRDVSFTIAPGECLAIVGESGSGKSVTARTLVGLAGDRASVSARELTFEGEDLSSLTESGWRAVRGRRIGLVLQDALVSLDPLRPVGAEVAETLRVHRVVDRAGIGERVLSLLADVGIPDADRRARQYPHELSGGLRQRALIASVLAAGPRLLVADEPTTALDVTVQAQILALLRGLKENGTALLLISHDLAVVTGLADRIAVMYGGLIVEEGPAAQVLGAPRHPYTRALIAAVPAAHAKGTPLSAVTAAGPAPGPDGCPYAARCAHADQQCRDKLPDPVEIGAGHRALCWYPSSHTPEPRPDLARLTAARREAREEGQAGEVVLAAEGVSKRFRTPGGGRHDAVRDVSFHLRAGETLGVVGESGSGKTTAARIALGLLEPDEGVVRLGGERWSGLPERERRTRRRRIQAVYQDPLGSFDPRHTVERVVGEAVALTGARREERRRRIAELLDQVGLPTTTMGRHPRELSGGQRQRVAIARALAPSPEVIVCDEPVSALDVSIQAQILDLLADLQRDLAVAMLFISHDLGVIHHVSDRIAVMKDGRIVETGDVAEVFATPAEPYTRELLAAVPTLVPERNRR